MRSCMTRRSLTVVCAVSALALTLSGCAGEPAFETPIRWSVATKLVGAERETRISSEIEAIDEIIIELNEGGKGQASDLPRGRLAERADGTICTEVTDEAPYAGSITWKPHDSWGLEIAYDGGSVLANSAPGVGGNDWGELRIFPCALESAYWRIGIECGPLGANADTAYGIEPCRAD